MVCVYNQSVYYSGQSSIIQETTFTRTTFGLARILDVFADGASRQTANFSTARADMITIISIIIIIIIILMSVTSVLSNIIIIIIISSSSSSSSSSVSVQTAEQSRPDELGRVEGLITNNQLLILLIVYNNNK